MTVRTTATRPAVPESAEAWQQVYDDIESFLLAATDGSYPYIPITNCASGPRCGQRPCLSKTKDMLPLQCDAPKHPARPILARGSGGGAAYLLLVAEVGRSCSQPPCARWKCQQRQPAGTVTAGRFSAILQSAHYDRAAG